MPGLRGTYDNAVSTHLTAVAALTAARQAWQATPLPGPDDTVIAAENQLARQLTAAASTLSNEPGFVRIGMARLHQATFPVMIPFVGSGHITFTEDSKEPRVAALIRSIILQALGTAKPGSIDVAVVDASAMGATTSAMQPLVDAHRMTAAATDERAFNKILDTAESRVKAGLRGENPTTLILALASAPHMNASTRSRLDALARSGVAAGLHIIGGGITDLPDSASITVNTDTMTVGNPPGAPFGASGALAAPVEFDPPLSTGYVMAESQRLAEAARSASIMTFADIVPTKLWQSDPSDGLVTVAGRDSQGEVSLAFDDLTPHWLIGGRTGGGKTVFLLDVLYGLTARYSPQDLALYLLDFKEGVSFTEFIPQDSDPSFIPHARAVGVESDREYGVAVLRELDGEMTRRSVIMKRAGVARYGELRRTQSLPRIVCIIDEFHVLFAGNDRLAKEAVAVLENLARKGRSYGVHLVLASQTASGIEALYTKKESIFGQFGMRIALPGATDVLDLHNNAAAGIRTGEAIINPDGGIAGRDRRVRFPNAHAESKTLYDLRHRMWKDRGAITAPAIFRGYAEAHLRDDPAYLLLNEQRPVAAFVGKQVDSALATATISLDNTPGRHLSVVGSDSTGAHILHAATLSIAKQAPYARFLIAGFAEPDTVMETRKDLARIDVVHTDVDSLGETLIELKEQSIPTFLIGFGLDAAGLNRAQQDALRVILRQGPASGIHVLGWWRGLRRFIDDIGGSAGKEDMAATVALNIPGNDLSSHFGQSVADWEPRPNRALLIDRHANTRRLIVPFTRPLEES